MRRSARRVGAVLFPVLALFAGCSAARPEWLQKEDEACFRTRDFAEEIPMADRGNPLRDPCWRYRGGGLRDM